MPCLALLGGKRNAWTNRVCILLYVRARGQMGMGKWGRMLHGVVGRRDSEVVIHDRLGMSNCGSIPVLSQVAIDSRRGWIRIANLVGI